MENELGEWEGVYIAGWDCKVSHIGVAVKSLNLHIMSRVLINT